MDNTFTYNRFMMKLFGTTDINVIKDCQAYFRVHKLRVKYYKNVAVNFLNSIVIRLTACAVIFAVSYCILSIFEYCEYVCTILYFSYRLR